MTGERLREELTREQAHIDRAYSALDRLREGAAAVEPAPFDDDEGAGGTLQERLERERAQALLHRPRSRDAAAVTWTHADVPLLHEATPCSGPWPARRHRPPSRARTSSSWSTG